MATIKMDMYKMCFTNSSSIQVHFLGLLLCLVGVPINAANNDTPALIEIPAGNYIVGSDADERELAYRLDESAYHSSITREQGWYDSELPRHLEQGKTFCITTTPVTNRQYASFVSATRHHAPSVDRKTWGSYKLIHPFENTRRFAWHERQPPQGREDHPVVLVNMIDAQSYAAWLTKQTGQHWRLPTETEWEMAMRGQGRFMG